MSDVNNVFGDAKFGVDKKHQFKFPKEGGSLILRILPSFGSLKKTGKWSQFYSIHFGYRDTKGKQRPFQSCQVKKDKMITVSDPAIERITKIKIALDKAKVEGNKELEAKLAEQLKIFNVKSSNYMNVMDLNGKIGFLSIPYRMKQALDAEIELLRAKGVNPISAQDGRYFVFTRTGFGSSTVHKVSVYQEEVEMNGMKVSIEKKSVLTQETAERMLAEGTDLGNMYIAPTQEDIQAIVSGDGRTLEQIFEKYRGSNSGDDGSGYEEDGDESSSVPTQTQQAAPVAAQPTLTTEVQTTPAVTTPAVAASAPVAPTTVGGKDITQMTNEEFLKSMGV